MDKQVMLSTVHATPTEDQVEVVTPATNELNTQTFIIGFSFCAYRLDQPVDLPNPHDKRPAKIVDPELIGIYFQAIKDKEPCRGSGERLRASRGALRNLPALSSGLDLVSLWFPFGFTLISRPRSGRQMRVKPKGNQSETKSRPLDKAGRLRRASKRLLTTA